MNSNYGLEIAARNIYDVNKFRSRDRGYGTDPFLASSISKSGFSTCVEDSLVQ